MQVVSIISTKGGVGKTTTAANLGGLAADAGLRVLLLDLDVQPTLSSYYELTQRAPGGIYELLAFNERDLGQLVSRTIIAGLDLVLSDDHRGEHDRQDRDQPEQPLAGRYPQHHEGEGKPDDELQHDRADRVDGGESQRFPEHAVHEHVAVMLEAGEAGDPGHGKIDLVQRRPNEVEKRRGRGDQQHDQAGRNEEGRERTFVPRRPSPPCAHRLHRRR